VEGTLGSRDDCAYYAFHVGDHPPGRYPQHPVPVLCDEFIPFSVPVGTIGSVVRETIDFDDQSGREAAEVDDI